MNTTAQHDKPFYLVLLGYALVEIRASAVSNPELAAGIADTFHHIPEALALDLNGDRDARLYNQLKAKAKVHGIEGLVSRWEASACRRGQSLKGQNTDPPGRPVQERPK